jgi:2,5-furandicarboxylate decarboxylase 1
MLPRHLKLCYEKSKALGRPLEIAIAIGVDPLTLLSSQAILPFGADELEVANSLHGSDQSLKLFRCPTVDLEVPAESEIVIEGRILLDETAVEGPFGEYPKYYSDAAKRPVVRIENICHRNDPLYYTILPASREHLLLGALAREASLLKFIRSCVPSVRGIHLTYGGTCRYHLVIGIEKTNEGEPRNAILAAMGNNADIKHVVAVDHDVDIFNMEEVEWAVATRVQGDRDIFMVPDCLVSQLDPSATKAVGTKLGVDATVPVGQLSEHFKRIRIPGYEELDLADFLD